MTKSIVQRQKGTLSCQLPRQGGLPDWRGPLISDCGYSPRGGQTPLSATRAPSKTSQLCLP
jgi:hypothetical protein